MKSPKEQQKEYSEIEQEAIKWLSETDDMQFSTMELLTMFAGHWQTKLKSMVSSSDVSDMFTASQIEEAWRDGDQSDSSGAPFCIDNYR